MKTCQPTGYLVLRITVNFNHKVMKIKQKVFKKEMHDDEFFSKCKRRKTKTENDRFHLNQ